MHNGFIPGVLFLMFVLPVLSQETDSLKITTLEEIVISESVTRRRNLNTSLNVEVANEQFLQQNFTGNLIQALGHIPGVHSMDIGSGFSKPMIRGMGFNRIVVAENGIKQEGQQWGADHGLEIDAFATEQVIVRKGPSSLLYGSDAMGGAIEIVHLPPPISEQVFGEVSLLGKSVNSTIGGSLMLGIKKGKWYVKGRFSEQHFADYRVPTDTIVYLTQLLPVHNKRLKNTAGFERDASLYSEFRNGRYYANYAISNAYQKTGFFPGAHGIPDASRIEDDGDRWNIDLPYSRVNHFKFTSRQQYIWDKFAGYWDIGYQNNSRQEWSEFHTHYGSQAAPEKDPNKELEFILDTYSSSIKIKTLTYDKWEHTVGWDIQYQHNRIGGYSFLLPRYNRFTTGGLWLSNYRLNSKLLFSGGLRFDYGKVDISQYEDTYLTDYLNENGYSSDIIEANKYRSYGVNRSFSDFSGSIGIVWNTNEKSLFKLNLGRSFRLPGANELASNGVHHGTFRHEQGDSNLSSEKGWQIDTSYDFYNEYFSFSVNPFVSWYENYIYLKPSGQWSVLPHAGQVYRYTGAEVVFAGGEITANIRFPFNLEYSLSGEYVYTYNRDENTPLSFSPPASVRNKIAWNKKNNTIYIEMQSIASQNRIARNEEATSGANLFHAGISSTIKLGNLFPQISFSVHNVFDRKYYNHLSFYRKVEIPEPGRNFQLLIKIPFKIN